MVTGVQTHSAVLAALQSLKRGGGEASPLQLRSGAGGADQGGAALLGDRVGWGSASLAGAVRAGLQQAQSLAEVTLSAGEKVYAMLAELKDHASAASDPDLAAADRAALDGKFKALLGEISRVVEAAEFGGVNLLDGSRAADLHVPADAEGRATITLARQDLTLGGPILALPADAALGSAEDAADLLGRLEAALGAAGEALVELGRQARQVGSHESFVSRLTEVLEGGVGQLVDADLATESARLRALQVKQELGAQPFSIASSSPQSVLQLFRD